MTCSRVFVSLVCACWVAMVGCSQAHVPAGDAGPFVVDARLDADDAPPNAAQFCVDRRSAECARDYLAMRLDGTGYNACAASIEGTCGGATWAPGCEVTRVTAGMCLAALRDMMRLETPNESLEECTDAALCE